MGQRLPPLQVVLSLGQIDLRPFDIGLADGDVGLQRIVLHEDRARMTYGLSQRGLGLSQCDAGIAGVQLDQKLALVDGLRIVRSYANDGAGYLRGYLDQVAMHVGIIGGFVVRGIDGPPYRVSDAYGDEYK